MLTPDTAAAARSPGQQLAGGRPREVPRRARRARRCRRLGGPQPAGPPERPGPRRPADRGRATTGLVLSTFDYETSARATLPADVADEGTALVSRPAARRHLPQPADQAGRDGHRRRQGRR